jgi:hypothetical protein
MASQPVSLIRYVSRVQAEILRDLLEAEGISVALSQEAAGSVLPVDVGAFGQVELLVPADQAERARQILGDLNRYSAPSDDAE